MGMRLIPGILLRCNGLTGIDSASTEWNRQSGEQSPLYFLAGGAYNTAMKTVAFETVGCRLNQYETEQIAAQFAKYGFRRVEFDEPADLYIVNTCTVTGRADASCRNIISRAARHEKNPPVVVIGCYVDAEPDKVAQLNGVDLVIKNSDKVKVLNILQEKFPHLFEEDRDIPQIEAITEFHLHNRAWIKIGDGCNQHCTYCVIPLVRGRLHNRAPEDITREINTLSQNGYNEVVLTGIHIGQYTYGDIESPAKLVRFILEKSDIVRIRLSSIEPQEVTAELIEAIIDGGRRVCRHLHIPLQSGSDRILKIMRRPYNVQRYREIVGQVKDRVPHVVIGADIIVGFPGETDDDFQQSVVAADSGLLDYLHVFSYSDRPGTDASRLSGKVNPDTIKNRNAVLRAISGKHYAEALKREVGEIAYVISEHRAESDNHYWGITDNYLKVKLPADVGGGKAVLAIRMESASERYLAGRMI